MSENTINHERSEPAKAECDAINRMLIDKFGIDTVTGLPMWRLAWSPAQFEKKLGTYSDFTDSGILIRTVTEVREVPKYPYLRPLYVLEMLQGIPAVNRKELPTATLSYECMHPLMHKITETYLPPYWPFVEWVIDCYYAALGRKSLRKYVSPDEDMGVMEAKRKRIDDITRYLYGNETSTTDALAYKTGITNPAGPEHFGKDTEH